MQSSRRKSNTREELCLLLSACYVFNQMSAPVVAWDTESDMYLIREFWVQLGL